MCHAYHVVTAGGIPASNVIVMAVDDIAHDDSNPFPGKIFNKPGDPGKDVYAGCKIDYSGSDVTPETFTKVLTGEATNTGSGKVLKSGANDKVFVNFVDHGGVGIIGFPRTTMSAKELTAAFTKMHKKKMYSELTFYLEACESGSMCQNQGFEKLNILCTTASNAQESSWGTYCGEDATVSGVEIGSCLGDLYSVNWMEDSDASDIGTETLKQQFDKVVKATDRSHVQAFGKTAYQSETVAQFQGDGSSANRLAGPATKSDHKSAMRSADATLASAFRRFTAHGDEGAADELIAGVQDRLSTKKRFAAIAKAVAGDARLATPFSFAGVINQDCHAAAHDAYKATCGEFSAAAMGFSGTLAALCEHTDGDTAPITAAITAACP